MPRAFTESEREEIRTQIRSVGESLFRRFGFRKTTVAELAKGVGVSKGAFYLFYERKEDLLLDIVSEYEKEARLAMDRVFASEADGRIALARVLKEQIAAIRRDPLIRELVTGDLLTQVWRGASAPYREENVRSDELYVARLAERYVTLNAPPTIVAGALRALVLASLHDEQIGESIADHVIDRLIEAVVEHFVEKDASPIHQERPAAGTADVDD